MLWGINQGRDNNDLIKEIMDWKSLDTGPLIVPPQEMIYEKIYDTGIFYDKQVKKWLVYYKTVKFGEFRSRVDAFDRLGDLIDLDEDKEYE